MNNLAKFFVKFIKFAFLGKVKSSRRIIDVDEADIRRSPNPRIVDIDEANPEQKSRIKLVTRINWLLMVICLSSFIFMFVYLLIYPDKPVPDLIQNAFFTTLGWFGGILGAFFQVNQNNN